MTPGLRRCLTTTSTTHPYALEDDSLRSVAIMLDRIVESFGGPEWKLGLEIMSSVRARCAPRHIAGELRELVPLVS